MSAFFYLPVLYQGVELEYRAQLVTFGYDYKFIVTIEHNDLIFETDDQGDFRVVGEHRRIKVDVDLLQCIIDSLQYLINK